MGNNQDVFRRPVEKVREAIPNSHVFGCEGAGVIAAREFSLQEALRRFSAQALCSDRNAFFRIDTGNSRLRIFVEYSARLGKLPLP